MQTQCWDNVWPRDGLSHKTRGMLNVCTLAPAFRLRRRAFGAPTKSFASCRRSEELAALCKPRHALVKQGLVHAIVRLDRIERHKECLKTA